MSPGWRVRVNVRSAGSYRYLNSPPPTGLGCAGYYSFPPADSLETVAPVLYLLLFCKEAVEHAV
jgi:hypothetical protein